MKKPARRTKAETRSEVVVPAPLKPIATAFESARGVTVEKGWGSGSVVLKVRGKIFVMLLGGDLVFKLPRERVDELVDGGAMRFDPRKDGRVMKEWVVIAAGTRNRTTLAREAHDFVGGGAGKRPKA
jgi:hypothetical protein